MKVVLRNPRRELEVRGPKTVTALLAELDVNAESVLVIADDELVARDARLRRRRDGRDPAGDVRGLRVRSRGSPASSAGRSTMKCRVCRGPAVIDVRRHNAAFCGDHFVVHCRDQVQRAIHAHRMIEAEDRVLVAVSGGKDSLGAVGPARGARHPC